MAGNFPYTFGIFLKPLIDKFGWSRAAISGCIAIRNICSSISSPVAGAMSDRLGPRKLILAGILMVVFSYLAAGRVSEIWQFYLFFGAVAGLGMSFLLVPILANITLWFGEKSAAANGLTLSGIGVAQILVPPVMTLLILHYGWETSCTILGAAIFVLAVPAWHFFRTPPARIYKPESSTPQTSPQQTGGKNYSLKEAMGVPAFWFMMLIMAILAACYQFITAHIVIASIDIGASPEAAAIALTLSGLTNTIGRIFLGALASKYGNKFMLTICMVIQLIGMFLLIGAKDLNTIYIGAAIHGLGYGGTAPISPTLTGEFFGTAAMGAVFGAINMSYTVGGAIGPFLAGYAFDLTGSYFWAFVSATAITLIGLALCIILRKPEGRSVAVKTGTTL